MPSFAEALVNAARNAERDNSPRLSHVGQVARLREFYERYDRPCPFVAGDLVTPRKDGSVEGAGEPYLVIEVAENASFHFIEDSSSFVSGRRLTIRVAAIRDDSILCWWCEHHEFEPFTGDGSRKGDLSAAA